MSKNRRRGPTGKKQSPAGPATRLPPNPPAAARDREVLVGAGLVALALVLAYANSLSGPFIFDDLTSIGGNATIRRWWDLAAVFSPPASGAAVQNRPLVNLSLAINWALGGEQVLGYHLFNLGLHLVATLTLLGVVRRTLRLPGLVGRFGADATWHATAVALLWGLHPLNTEAVTYTIQRTESMFSVFYLLTLYCSIRGFGASRPKGWFAAAVGCCLLGMGCKEAMVTAPLMVLLYDRVFVARTWEETFERRWGLYAGLAATWVLLLLILAKSAGGRGGAAGFGAGMTSWEYARTQFWAICHYLRLAFWPRGLVVDYGTWIARTPGQIVPYAVVVAVLAAATLAAWVRWPWAGYLGTWFFVLLAPSSSVVPLVTQTVAEKRMYLPLAAVVALVVFAGGAAGRRWLERAARPDPARRLRARALAAGTVACLAAVLGSLTVLRNRDYRSTLAIWDDAVKKRPDNARAWQNRGYAQGTLGAWEQERADCTRAIELKPDYVDAHNNRGNAFAALGDTARALADYSRAIELSPNFVDAYNNRGTTYSDLADYERAVQDFTKALELQPGAALVYSNRADARNALGQYRQALQDCEAALALSPNLAEAYCHRGNAFSGLGDTERALADYSRLIALRPGLPEAWGTRGATYLRVGAHDRAVQDLTRALELNPGYADAYANRALAYGRLKDYERAAADVAALRSLGVAPSSQVLGLLAQGRPAPAKP